MCMDGLVMCRYIHTHIHTYIYVYGWIINDASKTSNEVNSH